MKCSRTAHALFALLRAREVLNRVFGTGARLLWVYAGVFSCVGPDDVDQHGGDWNVVDAYRLRAIDF